MKLYLTDGRFWTGTQADAKAAGDKYVPIEVPTDKPSLIPFLQKLQDKITELRTKREDVPVEIVSATGETVPLVIPEVIEAPEPVAPPAPIERLAPTIDTIEDAIANADAKTIIRLLSSVVSRFGEIAGTRGWAAFAKDTYAWSPSAKNVEQGVGMMMLAAFKNFGWDKEA